VRVGFVEIVLLNLILIMSRLVINKSERAVASVGVTPDVSIHHEPTLKGGFAALAKKGTIRFTRYEERVG
jgi:hypothetical protein